MRLYTDKHLDDQLAADAGKVYQHVQRNPGITEDVLRRWGEQNGVGPDQMTRTLEFLQGDGKLHTAELPLALGELTVRSCTRLPLSVGWRGSRAGQGRPRRGALRPVSTMAEPSHPDARTASVGRPQRRSHRPPAYQRGREEAHVAGHLAEIDRHLAEIDSSVKHLDVIQDRLCDDFSGQAAAQSQRDAISEALAAHLRSTTSDQVTKRQFWQGIAVLCVMVAGLVLSQTHPFS